MNCPGPVEDYLTYQYGDWQTPKKTAVKNEYLTKNFFKNEIGVLKNIKETVRKLI